MLIQLHIEQLFWFCGRHMSRQRRALLCTYSSCHLPNLVSDCSIARCWHAANRNGGMTEGDATQTALWWRAWWSIPKWCVCRSKLQLIIKQDLYCKGAIFKNGSSFTDNCKKSKTISWPIFMLKAITHMRKRHTFPCDTVPLSSVVLTSAKFGLNYFVSIKTFPYLKVSSAMS